MSVVLAIALREIKALLSSPVIYAIGVFCAALFSYNFIKALQVFSQLSAAEGLQVPDAAKNIHYAVFMDHVSLLNVFLIFIVPVIAMKLLTEDRKQGSFVLLQSSPITCWQIVLGKFFAGLLISLVFVMMAFAYPLLISTIADFDWLLFASLFIGVLLLTASYMSLCLFASSLTQSTVLSAILGVLFILICIILSQLSFSDNSLVVLISEQLSLPENFNNFAQGTLNTKSLVFFVSFIYFFLFMSQRMTESFRWR